MNEQPERHWIDNVADLISGRMYNTLKALNQRNTLLLEALADMENIMTDNEQKIENAVASLRADRENIANAFNALREKIAQTPALTEDLSQELADLDAAVGGIHETATALAAPAEPVVAENHDPAGVADPSIDHGNNPVIPLAGESGATDAGVPNEVPQPGSPTSPPADEPTASAEPVLADTAPAVGDEGGSDDTGGPDDDEDDFDSAPPAPAPAPEVPVDQALPQTTEPALSDAPPSDPEFVASDPVTSEPVGGSDPATEAQTGGPINS